MNEEEDNQFLIDEIRELENVLDQKHTLNLGELASTSGTSNFNLILKQETRHDSGDDDESFCNEDDDSNDDSYKGYTCEDLHGLLELNKNLIACISSAQEKMVALLAECRDKQKFIEEIKSKHSNTCSTFKMSNFNAGMPYFKDRNFFCPRRNEDTETKIRHGELRLTELQRIHRWNQLDKSNLLKAIKEEVTATVSNSEDSDELPIKKSKTKANQLPKDVKKAIGSLGSIEFDWLKIANNMPDHKHNAEECEIMWKVFLHPDINKQRWTSKEDQNLNSIAKKYEFQNWDGIAKELNTSRSGYQCFVRYNTNNWKNLMRGQSWTVEDDEILHQLVAKTKIGDYIPWGYIASCIPDWTKQQIYFRWSYSIAPHIKKGRFSLEEDQILQEAVLKYGHNFSKISALLMNNRTNVQLKEHYQTLTLRQLQPRKIWTYEEDQQLLDLAKKYGSNWSKIASEMSMVSRVQVRQRFAALQKVEKKGVPLEKLIREPVPVETPIQTFFSYTKNTPWARENKDIHVKHEKIDEQLIHFFKKEIAQKKIVNESKKAYHPDRLKQDTKSLFKILQKFSANLTIPSDFGEEFDLSENNQQLLKSLHNYIEEKKNKNNQEVEETRIRMFGSHEPVQENERFIPPLPFGFCKRKKKQITGDGINYDLNINDLHKINVCMKLQPKKEVSEYLGEDVSIQFQKFEKYLTGGGIIPEDKQEEIFYLRCKPFTKSFFCVELEDEIPIIQENDVVEKPLKYDWHLNKMISKTQNDNSPEQIVEGMPLLLIEPNRTTLQAYQDLLLISKRFPSVSGIRNTNYKLSPKGQEALALFKRRYEQLFHIPNGLSRIIPPDVIDECSFSTVIEKLEKKKPKKSNRSTNSIKSVDSSKQ